LKSIATDPPHKKENTDGGEEDDDKNVECFAHFGPFLAAAAMPAQSDGVDTFTIILAFRLT
jgi:hypothetical protein